LAGLNSKLLALTLNYPTVPKAELQRLAGETWPAAIRGRMAKDHTHSGKFKGTSPERGCGEDETWWDERLRKVARQEAPDGKPE
jgi:hypothetical protein